MASSDLFHELSGLSPADQILVSRFGQGPAVLAPYSIVHEAFESIVDTHPEVVAARLGDKQITYGELELAANRLANYLIETGLQPRQRICLVVQRSFEMLVGIFAILKVGCQYVPVDGGVLSEHALQYILKDTEAQLVLCLPKFEDKINRCFGGNIATIVLGQGVEDFSSTERRNIPVSPEDGVYAIYTSGSTGKPKGVDVSHGNVTNALLLEPGNLGITIGTKVAQVLNVAFDMCAWEILACLLNGGTLHLRGSSWEETLSEVDVLITTPSILSKYSWQRFPNIKTIVTGGEACPQSLADDWAHNATFYNICGPTEVTILNSAHKHIPGLSLSIGKPLPNTTVYILDNEEKPFSIGSKGSMWVGGAGVTRGYINLPQLTASRYKVDKFRNDGSRMFNTGDIVSWREDGCLNTFGRLDDQVKIKGFRVELDGVAKVIEQFPGIVRASASLIDGVLYGFYTATTFIDEQDLDAFVRHHLPYYSVPEKWNYLAAIPLTPNGKMDKAQLSKVALSATRTMMIRRKSECATKDLYHPAPVRTKSRAIKGTSKTISEVPSKHLDYPVPLQTVSLQDPEKGVTEISSIDIAFADSISDHDTSSTKEDEEPNTLPAKKGLHGQRWLRHRALILYRRLFTIVIITNIAAAGIILYRRVKKQRPMLADLATATAANLCMAVLVRSDPVINLLFTTFCSVPVSWPLSIRRHCARIFHIGGIHSSCSIAATMWLFIFTIGASMDIAKPLDLRCIGIASITLTYIVLFIFIGMGSMSHPSFRAKYHNIWEMTHRFGGWIALILLWVQAFFTTRELTRNTGISPSQAYLHAPPIWLLTIATMAIIFPWLHLRKVPVRSEVLSNHALRLHFDYTTPVVGTAVRLAEHPLFDWHGFATITNANGKGFSLIISNAGDFTKRTIERAPSHIWVRGIPTCGVLRICTLFKSVVLVATGSGIGPCLAVVLSKKTPARILWTAPNPEQTFGQGIVDAVREKDPEAIIHNTRTMGKPDMNLMAYRLWKESGAEAVCVISNKRFTAQVVYAMESRGVPAFGAIFDS